VAGNQESTAQVTVFVDNHPPMVDIPDSWLVSEAVPLTVIEEGVLAGVEILIGSEGLGTKLFNFAPDQVPEFLAWDQRFDGGELAPVGEYSVIARAWDLAGNEGMDTAVIIVPGAEAQATPRPSVLTNPSSPPVAGKKPDVEPAKNTEAQTQALEIPESLKRFIHLWLWPVLAMVGMMISVGIAKATDPRPRALKRIMKEFKQYQEMNDLISPEDKGSIKEFYES
jgi:hypothetical protein